MWARLEPWQLRQLQRLAALDPERIEAVLNTVWAQYPNLYRETAIAAVDQEELGVHECADRLGIYPDEVEAQVIAFRHNTVAYDRAVVLDECTRVARLLEGQVAVWEVVREYRKLGSVERLKESFPMLPEGELAAALKYAEAHPQEIEALIGEYESVLAKRRAEYPFAR